MLDGVTNGAIYALLALALVLVFAVTRVIFIPQGEFVAYGALTLAVLQLGKAPGTVVAAGWCCAGRRGAARRGRRALRRGAAGARAGAQRRAARWPLPVAVVAVTLLGGAAEACRCWCRALLTLALVTPLGPLLYRLAYQPLADASVLVLLIVSVGVHFALTGLGLLFFGAEGSRTPSFWDAALHRRAAHAQRADGDHLRGRRSR